MSETQARRRLLSRAVKAILITAVNGALWLILWLFTSTFSTVNPQYPTLFGILAWAMLFFTFVTTLSEGTIYKYVFIVMRSFFITVYTIYVANFGFFSLSFEGFAITVEFMPLIAMVFLIGLLDVVKVLLQAIEFASQSQAAEA